MSPIKNVMGGLGHGNTDASYLDIDFAIECDGIGRTSIYESGTHMNGARHVSHCAVDDVFKVQVGPGDKVQYLQNDHVVFTSGKVPTFPLQVDTSMYVLGGYLTNAAVYSHAPGVDA
jgi:hypothetical protein